MKGEYDVVIVGAGTAGTYFGWKLAERGHSVAIFEKDPREQVGKRLDIFHIDSVRFDQFGIPVPEEGSEELIGVYPDGKALSPDGKIVKNVDYSFHVMRLTPFLRRMHILAESAGAEIFDRRTFKEPLFEGGELAGIGVEHEGKTHTIRARLVVDASGTAAAVRTSLPDGYGVENFRLGPGDVLYVVLRYIRWKDPTKPHPHGLNFWPFYKVFCNPSYTAEEAILGVGQPFSYSHSEEVLQEFLERVPLPPFEVEKIERGITPFRRPPYSLAGNGFICMGDAACITKPFSGEGVTAAWTLCKIASSLADQALKSGGTATRDALWMVNVQYFRDQGAKFAALLAQIPGAETLTEREMNYLFRKDIVFSEKDLSEMNRDYQTRITPARAARMLAAFLAGMLSGNFSFSHLKSLLQATGLSGKLARHYRAYPEDSRDFHGWVARAQSLWSKASFS